jgi:hypothetical protein
MDQSRDQQWVDFSGWPGDIEMFPSAWCSAGSSRSPRRRRSRRAHRSASPMRRWRPTPRSWRHAGRQRRAERNDVHGQGQLIREQARGRSHFPPIRKENEKIWERSLRAGRCAVSGSSWPTWSAGTSRSQGRPRGLPRSFHRVFAARASRSDTRPPEKSPPKEASKFGKGAFARQVPPRSLPRSLAAAACDDHTGVEGSTDQAR